MAVKEALRNMNTLIEEFKERKVKRIELFTKSEARHRLVLMSHNGKKGLFEEAYSTGMFGCKTRFFITEIDKGKLEEMILLQEYPFHLVSKEFVKVFLSEISVFAKERK